MPTHSPPRGYDPAVVAATLDALPIASHDPFVVGLSGLQGSGKSTFARQLVVAARARGIATVALSLDDFYLGRRARAVLARDVHPLLATRGVPGTHDVLLMLDTLDALARADARHPARLPRFDKGRDTRWVPSRWPKVATPPQLVVLEGWCVGVTAESEDALRVPRNALERDEDADARWRRWVNAKLGDDYARVWRRLHALVLLEAPDFAVVECWRNEQEQALRDRGAPHAMDTHALARFLMHYERLSRHALAALPEHAQVRVLLDDARRVRGIASAARQPAGAHPRQSLRSPLAPASPAASRRRTVPR